MKSDYIAGSENINTVVRGCRVPYNVETSQAPRLQPLSRLPAPEVTPAIRQPLGTVVTLHYTPAYIHTDLRFNRRLPSQEVNPFSQYPSVFFPLVLEENSYRPDALPVTQPTVSNYICLTASFPGQPG